MRRRVLKVCCVLLMALAVAGVVGPPAQATSSVEEARAALEEIAAQAASGMAAVVEQFAVTVPGLSTLAEINAAEASAIAEVDAIRSAARDQIKAIKRDHSKELRDEIDAADDAVDQARADSRAEISDLATAAAEQLTAAAAQQPEAQAPEPPPASPAQQNGAVQSSPPEDPSQVTTETTVAPVAQPAIASSLIIPALPDQTQGSESDGSPSEALGAATTPVIARTFEVVLPPAVAELVVYPLLVLEILARTVAEGGSRVLIPLSLLMATVVLLLWVDRRVKPKSPVFPAAP